jgi:hypothetical protein
VERRVDDLLHFRQRFANTPWTSNVSSRNADTWTIHEFWREVAKLGGFLGRKSDGDPGWQTLWRGWQKLDLMTLGARLTPTEDRNCG